MIIWGSRTKREGRGFVVKTCPHCRGDQPHFVAQSKTKFTLYFVPTITTSSKALLICTQCERQEEFGGVQAQSFVEAALPPELMLERLRREQSSGSAPTQSPNHALAVGMVVLALQVSLTDGVIDESEAAAISRAFDVIHTATKSEPVKQAAGLVVSDLGDILEWIKAPSTGPLDLMLASAGRVVRELDQADAARYIGQTAWLCENVAAASVGGREDGVTQMDAGLENMGFSPTEVAAALAFCEGAGG